LATATAFGHLEALDRPGAGGAGARQDGHRAAPGAGPGPSSRAGTRPATRQLTGPYGHVVVSNMPLSPPDLVARHNEVPLSENRCERQRYQGRNLAPRPAPPQGHQEGRRAA
jgi:hypothetical protein